LVYAATKPVAPIASVRPEVPAALAAIVERARAVDSAQPWAGARRKEGALEALGFASSIDGSRAPSAPPILETSLEKNGADEATQDPLEEARLSAAAAGLLNPRTTGGVATGHESTQRRQKRSVDFVAGTAALVVVAIVGSLVVRSRLTTGDASSASARGSAKSAAAAAPPSEIAPPSSRETDRDVPAASTASASASTTPAVSAPPARSGAIASPGWSITPASSTPPTPTVDWKDRQ
jgi:hypothetical protein